MGGVLMCGGKVGGAVDKVADKAKQGLSNIDPTTSEGLSNIATGGLAGGMLGIGLDDLLGGGAPEQEETASEKINARVAAQKYNMARDLDFVRDEYKQRVENLASGTARQAAVGRANIGAQAAGGQAHQATMQALRGRRVDPSSNAGMAALDAAARATGEASGRAGAESAFAVDTIAGQHQQNVIAQALGDQAAAVAGLSDIAHRANEAARQKAFGKHNARAARTEAIGTAVGLAGADTISGWLDGNTSTGNNNGSNSGQTTIK